MFANNLEMVFRALMQGINLYYIYYMTTIKKASLKIEIIFFLELPFLVAFCLWNLLSFKNITFVHLRNINICILIPLLFIRELYRTIISFEMNGFYSTKLIEISEIQIYLTIIHTSILIFKTTKSMNLRSAYVEFFEEPLMRYNARKETKLRRSQKLFISKILGYSRFLVCIMNMLVSIMEPSILDLVLILMTIYLLTKDKVTNFDFMVVTLYIDSIVILK